MRQGIVHGAALHDFLEPGQDLRLQRNLQMHAGRDRSDPRTPPYSTLIATDRCLACSVFGRRISRIPSLNVAPALPDCTSVGS